jgi:hypothetical protein
MTLTKSSKHLSRPQLMFPPVRVDMAVKRLGVVVYFKIGDSSEEDVTLVSEIRMRALPTT